jgi:hypothetical protein
VGGERDRAELACRSTQSFQPGVGVGPDGRVDTLGEVSQFDGLRPVSPRSLPAAEASGPLVIACGPPPVRARRSAAENRGERAPSQPGLGQHPSLGEVGETDRPRDDAVEPAGRSQFLERHELTVEATGVHRTAVELEDELGHRPTIEEQDDGATLPAMTHA